jgi:hypothetical protein
LRYRITLIVASLLTVLAVPLAMPSAEAATYPLQLAWMAAKCSAPPGSPTPVTPKRGIFADRPHRLRLPGNATPAPIWFGKIYYDSPGSDTGSNASLNAEYVTVKNTSSTTRSLTGYTVRDKANHVYKFGTFEGDPPFPLGKGRAVALCNARPTIRRSQ